MTSDPEKIDHTMMSPPQPQTDKP